MKFRFISGGVTTPRGYRASAVMAGIKELRKDLALLCSDATAAIAGVFTTNEVQAAPVKLCRERLAGRKARAILINSGNANACTGKQGMADAKRMAALAARQLSIPERLVFVCSTGTIGIPMPMAKIEAALPQAVAELSPDGGDAAAKAIMTTDTTDKQAAARLGAGGAAVTLGSMAKGAGMIEPHMATLLAFLTTDAAVRPVALQKCLAAAADRSFNRITVDGDQSTNDTVLFMANGAAGNDPLHERHRDWPAFCAAVNEVSSTLALMIVRDGEGATRLVTVSVKGAASNRDAELAARAVANSMLVKTSWYGGDPNWGRIMDAVGYSGARVVEERVDIRYDGLQTVKGGQVSKSASLKELERVLAKKEFAVEVNLHLGRGAYEIYTCDLSKEYVEINGAYMT